MGPKEFVMDDDIKYIYDVLINKKINIWIQRYCADEVEGWFG